LVDEIIDTQESLENFCKDLVAEDKYDDFIWEKQDYLEKNKDFIESYKENELAVMHNEFWDLNSSFHTLRKEFVYKICKIKTPKRLKWYNIE